MFLTVVSQISVCLRTRRLQHQTYLEDGTELVRRRYKITVSSCHAPQVSLELSLSSCLELDRAVCLPGRPLESRQAVPACVSRDLLAEARAGQLDRWDIW